MGTLTLVRHGQASFGAANYDQLSTVGELQSARLGAYLAQQSLRFDAVYHGSLQRHHQTWAGIATHLPIEGNTVHCRPGLNEFDGGALRQWLRQGKRLKRFNQTMAGVLCVTAFWMLKPYL